MENGELWYVHASQDNTVEPQLIIILQNPMASMRNGEDINPELVGYIRTQYVEHVNRPEHRLQIYQMTIDLEVAYVENDQLRFNSIILGSMNIP